MYDSRARKNSDSRTDDDFEALLVGMAKLIGLLVLWAVRFPLISTPIILAVLAAAVIDWRVGIVWAVAFAVGYAGWCHLDRESFERLVWFPIRTNWLTWLRYERTWDQVCALHGLTAQRGQRSFIPSLLWARIGDATDKLTVRIVAGQTAADWQKQSAALAEAWGCDRLTIKSAGPGEVTILIQREDELREPIALPRPIHGMHVDLANVAVGVAEGRRPWTLPVLGHHILVAGATGSGKGSVLWSIIAGLAPAVRMETVRLLVIDPKGGMELGHGAPLFARFIDDYGEPALALLRVLVIIMRRRQARLRGHTRLHVPTPSQPLLLVIIDELASLTAYSTDRKIRAETEQCLGLLLSQGRAVGVSVVAAAQDPSKDTLPMRQLFTVRVGLRMTEVTQTAMVLGAAAREAGAACDQIPDSTPGMGYVMVDGTREPLRVRAYHVTDADIDYIAHCFAPERRHRRPSKGE